MTIKEFAVLCGCSAQTLRYYDRVDLLKPARVDPWSGYRYYERDQALEFVKIKNLQAADFTIEEIKTLLPQSDLQIYAAFDEKIRQQEAKLAKIKEIRQSYLTEKNHMEQLIHNLSDFVLSSIQDLEGLREFGLTPEDAPKILAHVQSSMEAWARNSQPAPENISLLVDGELIRGADRVARKIEALSPNPMPGTMVLGNETLSQSDTFREENYEVLWDIHNWEHVYEFLDAIPALENDRDYCFRFLLKEEKYTEDLSFGLFMLGAMVLRKGSVKAAMGCSVERSPDGANHFALLRHK